MRGGFYKEKLGWGAGAARGGGKAAIATAFPTKTCVTHTETGKHWCGKRNRMHFGPEDLVKTKFGIHNSSKKSMGRAF